MLWETYVGGTVRIKARDLTHLDSGPVTTGATVTIVITNPDGSQLSSDVATNVNDDWSIDKTMPSVIGLYEVKATAVKSGATAKRKGFIRVKGF